MFVGGFCPTNPNPLYFGVQRNECRLNDCKVPRSCITSPNHHTTHAVLDSWHEVFLLICCVWLWPHVALCIVTKDLHFGVLYPKDMLPA